MQYVTNRIKNIFMNCSIVVESHPGMQQQCVQQHGTLNTWQRKKPNTTKYILNDCTDVKRQSRLFCRHRKEMAVSRDWGVGEWLLICTGFLGEGKS